MIDRRQRRDARRDLSLLRYFHVEDLPRRRVEDPRPGMDGNAWRGIRNALLIVAPFWAWVIWRWVS